MVSTGCFSNHKTKKPFSNYIRKWNQTKPIKKKKKKEKHT